LSNGLPLPIEIQKIYTSEKNAIGTAIFRTQSFNPRKSLSMILRKEILDGKEWILHINPAMQKRRYQKIWSLL